MEKIPVQDLPHVRGAYNQIVGKRGTIFMIPKLIKTMGDASSTSSMKPSETKEKSSVAKLDVIMLTPLLPAALILAAALLYQ